MSSTPHPRWTPHSWWLTVLFCALLAGCAAGGGGAASPAGTSSSGASGSGGPPVTAVRIGETAGIPTAFLRYGVEKGFYRDEGIDLRVEPIQGAASIITGVVAGELDLGGSDVVTYITARQRGLPLRVIGPGTAATTDPANDFSAVLVPADSPIREPRDLTGKKIAVNQLSNVGTVTIRGALDQAGIDSSTVQFVEVAFPDMLPTLKRGSVDAAWLIEPFLSAGQAQGNRAVMRPYVAFQPGMQIGSVVAAERYVTGNAATVAGFQRAHARTATTIAERPDDFRSRLKDLAGFDPQQAQRVVLPVWRDRINRDSMQQVAQAMQRYRLVPEVPQLAPHFDPGS